MKKIFYVILVVFISLTIVIGCEKKTINEDSTYYFHKISEEGYRGFPHLFFDAKIHRYYFIFDSNEYNQHVGNYEIKGNKLILTSLNNKEKFVFKIIDEHTLSFVESQSDKVFDETGYYYSLSEGDLLYDIEFKGFTKEEFDIERLYKDNLVIACIDASKEEIEYIEIDSIIHTDLVNDKLVIKEINEMKQFLIVIKDNIESYINYNFDYLYGPGVAHIDTLSKSYQKLIEDIENNKKICLMSVYIENHDSFVFCVTEDLNAYLICRTGSGNDDFEITYSHMNQLLPYMQEVTIEHYVLKK